MEPKSPSKLKLSIAGLNQHKRVVKLGVSVSVLCLLSLLFGFVFMFGSGEDYNGVSKGSYYTVVVDCGSTGTRVSVYEWAFRGENETTLPVLLRSHPSNSSESSVSKSSCKYHCLQTEPGLDRFVGNSSGVRDSLEPLIAFAEHIVPLERHRRTPIFVLATAGLRRLAKDDVTRVLNDIEAVVKKHSFKHRRDWIRVLSGKEEAYYGWVALNFKMRIFKNPFTSPTLGLLDLGGSSLQVVTKIDDSLKQDTHFLRSKLGFIEHQILAYSLPVFGLNAAFDRTIFLLSQTEALREDSGCSLELKHPCFGSGFVLNYTCHGCVGLNFSKLSDNSQANEIEDRSLRLRGEPNWEQCKMLARAVSVNSSSLAGEKSGLGLCSDRNSGILNLTANAHPNERFHALSGFFAVYDRLNLSSKANLTEIWERGQLLCSRTWADNKNNIAENRYYSSYLCFRVSYMASLIEDSLCLGDKEIFFGPSDVSWTLGAALMEGEYLWLSNAMPRNITILTSHLKLNSSPISVLLVLSCLLLIVYCSQVKLPMLGKKSSSKASTNLYVLPRRRPN